MKARQNKEAVESAHESRAASAMQMVREEAYPSEGTPQTVEGNGNPG